MNSQIELAERTGLLDTSQIRRMFDLAAKLKDPLNLSIGQPHFQTPAVIIEAMKKALDDGHTAYTQTQGILPLRERLAQKYKEENQIEVNAGQILITSGVSSILQLMFLTMINPGDRILTTDPCFLMYASLGRFYGAQVETVPEDFTKEDLQKVNSERLKLILFSSPSNPTGRILEEDQLRALANLAEKTGAVLAADEIYEKFDYDQKFISAGSLYENTITMTGFSKSYSMTGLRLAAVTGPQKIVDAMIKLQQYSVVCAPAPVQHAGITALDYNLTKEIADYKQKRDFVTGKLKKAGISHRRADGAIYVFVDIPGHCPVDLELAEKAIQEKELLIVPGRIFTESERFIRISYAQKDDVLEKGIDALTGLFESCT